MKTRLFLLAAATTIGFAACQNQKSEGYTQQQLDSIVQYKADSAANALKMVNDSITNKMAADSVAAANNLKTESKTTVTKTTITKKTSTPPTQAEKAPVVVPKGLKGHSDQANSNSGNGGLNSKSDQAKQQNTEQKGNGGGLRSKSDQSKQN